MSTKYAAGVIAIMILASIVPSLALAAPNNHGDNLFSGNFTDVKAKILDMINNEIARLQGASTNVSAANNMTELRTAMKDVRNGRDGYGMRGCMRDGREARMGQQDVVIGNGFNLNTIANVNDTTFPTVKENLVNTLQNVTVILQSQETITSQNGNTVRTTQIEAKIADIQNLSTQVDNTTTASDLQNVVLVFMKTQIDTDIDARIVNVQNMIQSITNENNTNMNVTALQDKITKLQTVKTSVDNAVTLSDLKTLIDNNKLPMMGGMGEVERVPVMRGAPTNHPMIRAELDNNIADVDQPPADINDTGNASQ